MQKMVSDFLVAVVWGVLLTIFVQIIGILIWFYQQVDTPARPIHPDTGPGAQTPESISNLYSRNGEDSSTQSSTRMESCDWLNILIDFSFHQLRDSTEVKRLIMKQIHKEFTDLLMTKTQGKMIEHLSVREYNLGDSLPVFSDITIVKAERDDDSNKPKIVEVEMNAVYEGGFHLAIDADLVFNKAAYVSIQVNRVQGRGRLQLSSLPVTHWSFSFIQDPLIEISVGCRFEGRELTQLSKFIETQIIRWVKKYHTLPNYKVRFKPLFRKIKPQNQLIDVHFHDNKISQGRLEVHVIECGRLRLSDTAVELYCTLSADETPRDPQIGYWQGVWPSREITITRNSPSEALGIRYQMFPYGEDGKGNVVIVTQVLPHSAAHYGGIKKGDILSRIENVKIASVKHADKLIKKLQDLRLLVTVKRPSIDLLKLLKRQSLTYGHSYTHRKSRKSSQKLKTVPSIIVTGVSDNNSVKGEQEKEDEEEEEEEEQKCEEQEEQEEEEEGFELISSELSRLKKRGKRKTTKRGLGDRAWSTPPVDMDQPERRVDEHQLLVSSMETANLSSDPILVRGASLPNDLESRENESHDNHISSCDSHQTKSISVSRNPVWDEKFECPVRSCHQYLNVCVWSRLQGEGNLMIGQVSLSLTDIALECATSGCHRQRYVLSPAQPIKTSKTALKLKSELPPTAKISKTVSSREFVGDILLSFVHTPEDIEDIKDDKNIKDENSSQSDDSGKKFISHHPFTAVEGTEPEKHNFQSVELKRSEKHCYVCHNRIWKGALQCTRCNIISHRKCSQYCLQVVLCTPQGSCPNDAPITSVNQLEEGWEELEYDTYCESKQISFEDEDIENGSQMNAFMFVPECEEERSSEVDNFTPENVSSESDDEEKKELGEEFIDGPMLQDFADTIAQDELESKILEAQKHLELLEEEKRSISSSLDDPSINRESVEYKLQKLDAQKEITYIMLQQYKQKLRNICN